MYAAARLWTLLLSVYWHPMMAKWQPKAKKHMIKIPAHRALPAVADDKVDKLLELPLSAANLQPAEAEILDGTRQDRSLQAQGSQYDTIDLANSVENSCEEQDVTDIYDVLYESRSIEVEEYWQSDSKGK